MSPKKPFQRKIDASELRQLRTCITQFMVDRSFNNKTFDELLEIFNNCHKNYTPDPSEDLRIYDYAMSMKEKRWNEDIVLLFRDGEVKDGVHRGIAYLKCIDEGVIAKHLPRIFLDGQ